MTDLRKVQAAEGARVLNPDTMKPIPAFGNEAGKSFQIDADRPFWHRRLRDGDVVEVDDDGNPIKAEPAEAEAPPPALPAPPVSSAKSSTKAQTADANAPAGSDQTSAKE
jgi:hypothetical protein